MFLLFVCNIQKSALFSCHITFTETLQYFVCHIPVTEIFCLSHPGHWNILYVTSLTKKHFVCHITFNEPYLLAILQSLKYFICQIPVTEKCCLSHSKEEFFYLFIILSLLLVIYYKTIKKMLLILIERLMWRLCQAHKSSCMHHSLGSFQNEYFG